MTALRLGLAVGASSTLRSGGGASASTGAAALLGAETNGLAFSAFDDSMEIRDTVTPANNYVGSTITKFGSIRSSAAMRYGSTGLLEWGPENLCTYSEDLTHANWLKNVITATANSTTAPDGMVTADLLTATGTSNAVIYNQVGTPVGAYTWSVYVKKGTGNFLALSANDGPNNYTYFNLTTGAVATNAAGNTASITSVGNGWYRCVLSRTSATIALLMAFNITDADNSLAVTNGVTMYAWGAMINHGSAVSAYLPTTSSAAYGLRRDYDPRVAGPKYLIEEARTNQVLYSSDFSNAAWAKTGMTITSNATTAPDGTTTASKFDPTGTSSYSDCYVHQACGVGPQLNTTSFFVKSAGFSWIACRHYTAGENLLWFNISTGVVGTSSGTITGTITDVGNGWYRVTTTTTGSVGSNYIGICPVNGDGTQVITSAGTNGIYVWGAQFEVGAFASSYIPTTSAQVSRSGDLIDFSTTLFNYQTATATVYGKYSVPSNTVVSGQLFNTGTRNIQVAINSGTPTVYGDNSVSIAAASTPAALTTNKVALAAEINNYALSLNGAAVVTDTSTTALSAQTIFNIGTWSSGYQLNGWIVEGMHLPRRISNAELVTRTTP